MASGLGLLRLGLLTERPGLHVAEAKHTAGVSNGVGADTWCNSCTTGCAQSRRVRGTFCASDRSLVLTVAGPQLCTNMHRASCLVRQPARLLASAVRVVGCYIPGARAGGLQCPRPGWVWCHRIVGQSQLPAERVDFRSECVTLTLMFTLVKCFGEHLQSGSQMHAAVSMAWACCTCTLSQRHSLASMFPHKGQLNQLQPRNCVLRPCSLCCMFQSVAASAAMMV